MDAQPLSPRNPEISHLRRLCGRRRARVEAGAFVIEGTTLLADALAAGVVPRSVYVDAAESLDVAQLAIVEAAHAAGAKTSTVAPGVLARLADTVTPPGVMSVLAREPASLHGLVAQDRATSSLVLVLAGICDPGNAGTLVRSAEASGATGVVFCAGSVDPFGPKTVRSSAGSVLRIPVVDGREVPEVLAALGAASYLRVGTAAHEGVPYDELDMRARVALVLGNEARGLAPEVLDLVDTVVTIPMVGRTESLNVAMAGTLVCFEALRQRRTDWTDEAAHDRVGR